jgi:hypothetical protein
MYLYYQQLVWFDFSQEPVFQLQVNASPKSATMILIIHTINQSNLHEFHSKQLSRHGHVFIMCAWLSLTKYTSQNLQPVTQNFQILFELSYETMWIFTQGFVYQYSVIW